MHSNLETTGQVSKKGDLMFIFAWLSVNLSAVSLLTQPWEILNINLIFDGPISWQFQHSILESKYLQWSLIWLLVFIYGIVIIEQLERKKFWKKHSKIENPWIKVKCVGVKWQCNKKKSNSLKKIIVDQWLTKNKFCSQ